MKQLAALVRKVIIGTTALLTAGNASPEKETIQESTRQGAGSEHSIKQGNHPSGPPKLVLKKVQLSDDWTLASHRSHRSHSSHRSSYTSPDEKKKPESTPKRPDRRQQSEELRLYQSGTSRTLKKGMKGPDVVELKKLLQNHGYKLPLTENFDDLTEIIVKDFQAKNDIPDDGIVAPLTLYMLKQGN